MGNQINEQRKTDSTAISGTIGVPTERVDIDETSCLSETRDISCWCTIAHRANYLIHSGCTIELNGHPFNDDPFEFFLFLSVGSEQPTIAAGTSISGIKWPGGSQPEMHGSTIIHFRGFDNYYYGQVFTGFISQT